MKKFKEYITKENLVIIIIMLLSVLVSTIFIFDKGLYEAVDTKYHMSRIIGIVNSWKAGNIPAYIHLDDTGYGYAMGFFYSNLFMIFPCIIYMISNDIFLAYKLLLILCSLFTAISMYVCVKKITRSKYAATISTILYTTCGYRIITMVAKAFVGELLSFIFIPIIILGLYELIFNNEKKWWIFALGFIGILNSNLVMTEIMIAISAIIVLCNIKTILKNRTRLTGFIKATIFTLLICSAFWMPLIEQLCKSSFVMTEKMSIYKPTRWLLDFCDMFWGTIQYENNLAAAYGLGIIFIVILLFRLKIKENDKILKFCDISILTGLILLLCMTYFFPWKYVETLGEMIQFPSRMEVPVAAFFSVACGIICNYFTKGKLKIRKSVIIGIVIWQTVFGVVCLKSCINALIDAHGAESKQEINVTNDFEYDICDGIYLPSKGNYIYAILENRKAKYYENDDYIKNEYDMIDDLENVKYEYKKADLKIDVNYENNTGQNTYIELPMYYYYGYVAESVNDGSTYKIEQGDNGLIKIYLNKEKDSIKVYYKLTNIQKISIIISLITLIWLIYFIIKRLKNKGGIKIEKK